MMIDGKKRFV